ncbi:MAG: histone deacetylase [Candidatus Eisenbacteria bacterium]
MPSRAAVIYSPRYQCDIGAHVFPMEKFERVLAELVATGAIRADDVQEPAPASRAELELVHTGAYLDDLFTLRHTPRTAASELPLTREIVSAYALAAGGTTLAAREALARGAAINLGGGFHHAFADMASGFCYLNDLAVALRVLEREGRYDRAAVVDVDLHQGNGTARIFRDDPRVFTFSIHQEHLYPVKERSRLDIGLDDFTGDEEYLARLADGLEQVWASRPDLVLVQAGADPFEDDQLGSLRLTFAGLERRDRMVLEGCAERRIPVAVTLGGGYSRRFEDLVRIHAATCRVALALPAWAAA